MRKKTIKVIYLDGWRDGGTVQYKDKKGNTYCAWPMLNRVFDKYPGSPGSTKLEDGVKELNVKLQVVSSF